MFCNLNDCIITDKCWVWAGLSYIDNTVAYYCLNCDW